MQVRKAGAGKKETIGERLGRNNASNRHSVNSRHNASSRSVGSRPSSRHKERSSLYSVGRLRRVCPLSRSSANSSLLRTEEIGAASVQSKFSSGMKLGSNSSEPLRSSVSVRSISGRLNSESSTTIKNAKPIDADRSPYGVR